MNQKPLQINSEIGVLKTVLLHRPGEELENLTPDYLKDLLFDDIPHLKVAQEEHDEFANVLRDHGVEVLYLDELVTEALNSDNLKAEFVDEMLAASKQDSRRVTQSLRDTYCRCRPTRWCAKLWPVCAKTRFLCRQSITSSCTIWSSKTIIHST